MRDEDLNRNLWEAIRAWREMYLSAQPDETSWNALLSAPEPDFAESHPVFCAIEQNRFGGICVVMTDAHNNVVERLKISPPYTRED